MVQRQSATAAVRNGIESDTQYGAVVPPLYLSTNYSFDGHKTPREFDYSRSGNPTRSVLAKTLAELEQGVSAVITSTGMSAITLVTALLEQGDVLVVPHDCYGGSLRLFNHLANKSHFTLNIIDQTDELAWESAIAAKPALIWLETPSNPLLRVVDIEAVVKKAKTVNARVAVDNTFLSPILQQPIVLGADIVVHSTTKYINGHSDVVGGVVISADNELGEKLDWLANTLGLSGGAFDAYLTLRGIRTLPLRIKQHEFNAQRIVAQLHEHSQVAKLYYPGLPEHPEHEIAKKQQRGFGGMISFELKGGEDSLVTFLESLTLFSVAESLGGVESLLAVPATMTHRSMDNAAQLSAGISPNLIRLSVGIEDSQDLVNDIQTALDAAARCNGVDAQ
ncbi:MAG: cystathionine gamma-synthase [Shewanella sp.]|nr:cystathionine gamma-synthase [Shewanella sp.]